MRYLILIVVIGLTSSPFILNGTIQQHLKKSEDNYDFNVIKQLGEDLYVDDITSGVESSLEGEVFFTTAVNVMKEAGLELRK